MSSPLPWPHEYIAAGNNVCNPSQGTTKRPLRRLLDWDCRFAPECSSGAMSGPLGDERLLSPRSEVVHVKRS
jgi:hypothetical protein